MTTELLRSVPPIGPSAGRSAPTDVRVEEVGNRTPIHHGTARLVPIRTPQGELIFAVESFAGTRLAGHQPLMVGDGPRTLLSDAGPLPASLEERVRAVYKSARRQELLVHRAGTAFAVELLPDSGGVTAVWSELPASGPEAPSAADGGFSNQPTTAPTGRLVDTDGPLEAGLVGCVTMEAQIEDGRIVDFVCRSTVADEGLAGALPASGVRLRQLLPASGGDAGVSSLARCVAERRSFRPPANLFGAEIDDRYAVHGLVLNTSVLLLFRRRIIRKAVLDLREGDQIVLTRREREILLLLADGASTIEIARTLYLSTNTVRNHVRRLLNHLGASSRLEAVVIAAKTGLLELRRDPGR